MPIGIKIVFARYTGAIPDAWGNPMHIDGGSHWPIDDPLVRQHPEAFSADPRFGLRYSAGAEPACMHEPEDPPYVVEQATRAPGERRPMLGRRA